MKTWHSRRAARYGRSPWSTRVYRRSPLKVSASSWSTRTTCSSGKSRSSVRPTLSTRADISRYPAVPLCAVYGVHRCARVYLRESRRAFRATAISMLAPRYRIYTRLVAPFLVMSRLSTSRPVFHSVRGRI